MGRYKSPVLVIMDTVPNIDESYSIAPPLTSRNRQTPEISYQQSLVLNLQWNWKNRDSIATPNITIFIAYEQSTRRPRLRYCRLLLTGDFTTGFRNTIGSNRIFNAWSLHSALRRFVHNKNNFTYLIWLILRPHFTRRITKTHALKTSPWTGYALNVIDICTLMTSAVNTSRLFA